MACYIVIDAICDPEDEFRCTNFFGHDACINASLVCNGVEDCRELEGSEGDEFGCDEQGK